MFNAQFRYCNILGGFKVFWIVTHWPKKCSRKCKPSLFTLAQLRSDAFSAPTGYIMCLFGCVCICWLTKSVEIAGLPPPKKKIERKTADILSCCDLQKTFKACSKFSCWQVMWDCNDLLKGMEGFPTPFVLLVAWTKSYVK